MADFLPPLLTIPETAEALRLKSRDAVYDLIARGDLDAVDIAPTGSRRPKTRVPRESVNAFIKRRTRNAKRLRVAT
jgi:hypothetical protein